MQQEINQRRTHRKNFKGLTISEAQYKEKAMRWGQMWRQGRKDWIS